MSREIKFRAWCPHNKEMYTDENSPEYTFTVSNGTIGFIPNRGFDDLSYFYSGIKDDNENGFLNIIPMQYAGIKDRKGIDIYEGDILKCDFSHDNNGLHDSIQVVEFYEGSFGSRNKGDHFRIPALFSGRATEGMNLNYYEIIGNIYQNPDLAN